MKLLLRIVFLLLLLTGVEMSAQLPVPQFTVDVLDETCDGTGQLTFNLTGIAQGATVLYSVFLLPDVTVPVYSGANSVVSLPGGTYNVVAVQTLGAESNFVSVENIVIQDLVGVLNYRVVAGNNPCGGGNNITVNVTAGQAVQYELLGPVTVPPQSSNVFSGLPQGDYMVRVYDQCGAVVPQSVSLTAPDNTPPVVSDPIFDEVLSTDCTSVNITHTVSYAQGTLIVYPLTVVYILHPGDGSAAEVTTVTIESGDTAEAVFSHTFPIFPGRVDTYSISVTNGCGIRFPVKTGMVTTPTPILLIRKNPILCNQHTLTFTASNFVPPYTLNFIDAPPTFNPQAFNPDYPGPFTDTVTWYGTQEHPVPNGYYEVELTDACGRTTTNSMDVIREKPDPTLRGFNNGCFSVIGYITASIPDREIVFAEIVRGPSAFTTPVPYDVSSMIGSNGTLRVNNLPVGEYLIRIQDDCGDWYDEVIEVPAFVPKDFVATVQPDCAVGFGGVKIDSPNSSLVLVRIISAPPEFNEGVTPVDLNELIFTNGDFFVDGLPEGDYRFEVADFCGITQILDVNVVGAEVPPASAIVLDPRCNAFNVGLFDVSTVSSATYWLQMEDPNMPGRWVNPETGVEYTEGTVPDSTNSIQLLNNTNNVNFDYSGTFRILRYFQGIGNGVTSKNCITPFGDTFSYSDDVIINEVYTVGCLPGSVYVDATGLPPLTYSIYEKDGEPFVINNGSNPIFNNLDPGTYRFRVENVCTEQQVTLRDISTLPDIVVANPVGGLQICIESGDSEFQEFNLEELTPGILGTQSPVVYTVTYHVSQSDALSGNNPITSPYTNVRNPQTIYARVTHDFINVCPKTISFPIRSTLNPVLFMPEKQYICENVGRLVLSANEGYDAYEWLSNHPITQLSPSAIEVYEPGIYTVNVSRIIGSQPACITSVDIEVLQSEAPQSISVELDDWTENNNTITVFADGQGEYEYSLDGDEYQDSNVFRGLRPGIYTVYVNDKSQCGFLTKEVVLLNYPKYFTPNGDGTHETWHIRYSWMEPGMLVYIFDRFGKLITSFDAQSEGWDGTFHGHPLPATDYWFLVHRQDGRIHRGHFALIR
ncbi:T9SS type B sorting domain-containing protein [Flavobacterium sp. Sd200]|uniref:T9SS type B sorting domain-containing protein n=1 Tax=Flavobacterium sp. Sd200 TaxID=2692211 RepID=UPI00136CBFF4|nr:T9SS type B sorting domain-containing protein [Flavobacterium sp. Sd200]MXN90989.1 T9SS type B sorting domain-containing protein [Flavobacterium sp. Sd200]